MWYVLRTGIPWRDLTERFGPWSSVYTWFRRWCTNGLWATILGQLGHAAFERIRCMDCSHIKIHRDGANPIGGQAWQAMGRTKGGLNTKLAAVVDAVGRAIGLNLAPGQ
jgi:transposase